MRDAFEACTVGRFFTLMLNSILIPISFVAPVVAVIFLLVSIYKLISYFIAKKSGRPVSLKDFKLSTSIFLISFLVFIISFWLLLKGLPKHGIGI